MTDALPWIMIGLAAALIVFIAMVFVYRKSKGKVKEDVDYRTFFIIGLIWTLISIPMMLADGYNSFFILGLVFLALGTANKKKWKKDPIVINRTFALITAAAGVAVLAAIAVYIRLVTG